jgi:hypothetical protein
VHSFTSSSERIGKRMPWVTVLGVSSMIFLACAALIEFELARRGFVPATQDNAGRWVHERKRASSFGKKALILIGASRIQLAFDLDLLRRHTGLEPVQLAVDGSSFEAVLAGLADDPSVTGTIVVDYYDVAVGVDKGTAAAYQRQFLAASGNGFASPYATVETELSKIVHDRLAAYADGASPWNSLTTRILSKDAVRSYLTTFPDRSRLADYRRVSMPDFYFNRVAITLGERGGNVGHTRAALEQRVKEVTPLDDQSFIDAARKVRTKIEKIEARGGRVLFAAMPSSGMVRQIEERRYPQRLFWNQFVRIVGVTAVRASDLPELQDVVCPDGSHVDMRDRQRVTSAMLRALGLQRRPG